ncbi:PAS domain S-box protein [Endomicrobium sp. AH-315-J14]|nr:PAS domain S-box protein [Endomicrobium sp. AH-315-J14]
MSAKRGVSAIAERSDTFRQILEACPTGMLLVDSKGTIEFASSSATAMFGYECDELAGQPIEVLVPPPHRTGHGCLRDAYRTTSACCR